MIPNHCGHNKLKPQEINKLDIMVVTSQSWTDNLRTGNFFKYLGYIRGNTNTAKPTKFSTYYLDEPR